MAAARYFDQLEIYPGAFHTPPYACIARTHDSTGSKLTHFKKIHEKTGIPYEEMVSTPSTWAFNHILMAYAAVL